MEAFSKSHDTGAKEKCPLKSIALVQRRNAQDTEKCEECTQNHAAKGKLPYCKRPKRSLFRFLSKKS
jgi:hypothetical protein